ncbi:lipopolysaccharide biosynthesis protein [Micromonospora craniellae]|uniref:lipopolysaccharide biosynthesis protein n=1 Tax=Micromonospora craniellae TaxID=2294034 RepID=UPI001314E349|nr:teichoic acid transporter [Micromonospora craniellae]QOC90137.1 teichoic acid transporter [Micromonospora craniellae]
MSRLRALVRDSSMLRSAAALYGSTVVTAGLGFAFWAVAARLASPAEVGSAAAAISAMQLIGSFCTFGLGSLLIAELARRPASVPWRLVSASLAVSATAGLVLSYLLVLVVGGILGIGGPLFTTWSGQFLFALGVAGHAATAVLDLALVGAKLSGRQLLRNASFAVAKLAALPIFAAVIGLSAGWIYAAWLAGAVLSVGVVLSRSSRPSRWLRLPASPTALRGLGAKATGHHVINVSAHAPSLVLPMVVATVLHPVDNAGFYMALQIASFAWAVSVHMSTALFAVSAGDHSRLRRELHVAMRTALLVTAVGAVASPLLGAWALGILGSAYVAAAPALTLLIVATLPAAVKALFIAVCRVQGRLRLAATSVLSGSALEIALGSVGAFYGVTGVAAGFLLATVVQAVVMWPRVAHAAGYRIAYRRSAPTPDPVAAGAEPDAAETSGREEPVPAGESGRG